MEGVGVSKDASLNGSGPVFAFVREGLEDKSGRDGVGSRKPVSMLYRLIEHGAI